MTYLQKLTAMQLSQLEMAVLKSLIPLEMLLRRPRLLLTVRAIDSSVPVPTLLLMVSSIDGILMVVVSDQGDNNDLPLVGNDFVDAD